MNSGIRINPPYLGTKTKLTLGQTIVGTKKCTFLFFYKGFVSIEKRLEGEFLDGEYMASSIGSKHLLVGVRSSFYMWAGI